jgi:hypothetical protein
MTNEENSSMTVRRERLSPIIREKLPNFLKWSAHSYVFSKAKRQKDSIINRTFWTVRTLFFWVSWILIFGLIIWLIYLATLALVSLIVPEEFDYLPSGLIATFFDIALIVGLCEVFRRWLGTQPNPFDNP